MSSSKTKSSPCTCQNCGHGCSGKKHAHEAEEKPPGFFSRHAWIWIALGYAAFLGVMFTFVWIAQTHAQPSITP